MLRNSIDQEKDTRHAGLFSEILATMFRHSDPFGNAWVEVSDSQEIILRSRYVDVDDGRTYEIKQTMNLYVTANDLGKRQ